MEQSFNEWNDPPLHPQKYSAADFPSGPPWSEKLVAGQRFINLNVHVIVCVCVFIELALNWRSDEQQKTSGSVQKHRKLERAENIPVWTHDHTQRWFRFRSKKQKQIDKSINSAYIRTETLIKSRALQKVQHSSHYYLCLYRFMHQTRS